MAEGSDPEPVLLSVDQAVRACALSRSTLYQLIRSGEIATVKLGGRRLIPYKGLQALVERLTEQQKPGG